MKKITLLLVIVSATFQVNGQIGFYKNFWGVLSPSSPYPPILCSMDKTSDGGYIVTTTNQQLGNASYLRLNSNFNKRWVSTYSISNSGFLDRAIELDDKGFVGFYAYDNFSPSSFTKQDSLGNSIFSNNYHTATSTNFHANAVCRSHNSDNGFVAMYSGCELHYGITKFNTNGDVVWCKDYSSGGYNAQTDELIHGINHGYVTCGLFLNTTINHYVAVVAQFNNNGDFHRAKHIILDSNRISWVRKITAGKDNNYYAIGSTQKDAPTYSRDQWMDLIKLDTNLNIVKCWKITPPAANRLFHVENILSLPDSTLILNGMTTDTNQTTRVFFMLKFNPKAGGSIIWSKSWTSPIIHFGPYSGAESGLFTYGPKANIVTSIFSNWDGACIASTDSSGNGLCNSSESLVTASLYSGYSVSHAPLFQNIIPLLKFPVTMIPTTILYRDTVLCGAMPSAINEIKKQINVTVAPNPFNHQTSISFNEEQINSLIIITDVLGKEIKSQTFSGDILIIDKGEMKDGIYFVKIIDKDKNVGNVKIILQ
jgi:hypothetical protein